MPVSPSHWHCAQSDSVRLRLSASVSRLAERIPQALGTQPGLNSLSCHESRARSDSLHWPGTVTVTVTETVTLGDAGHWPGKSPVAFILHDSESRPGFMYCCASES